MDALATLSFLAQSDVARQHSYLKWMLHSLGPFYGLAIPLVGFAVFVGACLVVAMNRRPAVIASYLVFLPLPLLIGLYGSLQGFISSYHLIATSPTSPKPSEIAAGVSTGLFTVLVGLMVIFPSYFVLAFGLLIRTIQSGRTPANHVGG